MSPLALLYFLLGRSIIRAVLAVVNLCVFALFVLCVLNPRFPVQTWLGAGFIVILFPYALCGMLVCVVLDVLFYRLFALLAIVLLLCFAKQIFVFYAPRVFSTFTKEKKTPRTLRVMTWNVRRFQPVGSNNIYDIAFTSEHDSVFRQYNPDVVCVQEFTFQSHPHKARFDIQRIFRERLGYKYVCFVKDYHMSNGFSCGNALFSRFPIVQTKTIDLSMKVYGNNKQVARALYADIQLFHRDTIRVFTAHLQSYGIQPKEYENIENMRGMKPTQWATATQMFKRMFSCYVERTKQAELLAASLRRSLYPVVWCGDMNDLPLSRTYFELSRNLQDVFLEKGSGVGSTYTTFLPMLRIDYIFCDKRFTVEQMTIPHTFISDHHPVVTDLALRTKTQ